MTTQSPDSAVLQLLGDSVRRTLGIDLQGAARLGGGTNNAVYRLETATGLVVAKHYFVHADDPRDRLRTEYEMLRFLWKHGVRCIPEPLARDPAHELAYYQHIPGRALSADQLSLTDVSTLSDLLTAMWALRGRADATALPPGSEACLAPADHLVGIERRLQQLSEQVADDPLGREARRFAESEVRHHLEQCRAALQRRSDYHRQLPRSEQTLSPSDVGFHNALRTPEAQIVFLDFEYAGWDDPAAMLANACRQPAVPLPAPLRRALVRTVLAVVDDCDRVADRLRAIYPAVGLKWVLLLLNEFSPVSFQRRKHAQGDFSLPARQRRQLDRAKALLAQLRCELTNKAAPV